MLPVGENLLLLLVALAISMVTYRLVENPIRHRRPPPRRSVFARVGLVLSTTLILSALIVPEATAMCAPTADDLTGRALGS